MLKRPFPFELAVFLVSLVSYLALAVWMLRVWLPLGDEPHYLLAAYSLVHDGDLDLANNYAHRDFQSFTGGETLDPHVKILPGGAQILNHDLGLPFLIALPFALGGRAGVEVFLALCGALLALQMWKLALDVTQSRLWATAASFALAFTPPLALYATLIYPELIGALIFLWSVRLTLITPPLQVSKLARVALVLATLLLPWLSIRFIVLVAMLILFVVIRWRAQPLRAVSVIAFAVLGIAAYWFINSVLLAGSVPRGNPTELASGNIGSLSVTSFARGVLGWWIDPQRGTLILAPVYVFALAGIPRHLRTNLPIGVLLLLPLAVLVPLVAVLGGFWIPFEVGARYFVVVLPLLVAPLAVALRAGLESAGQARRRQLAFGLAAAFLILLSIWNTALVVSDASYAYGSVVSAYSRVVGTDLSIFFAGMGHAVQITPANAPPPRGSVVAVGEREGETVWHAAAGSAGTLIQSFDLTELTVGNYDLEFRAAAQGENSAAESITLELYSAEGLPIVHSGWDAGALASPNALTPIVVNFNNPYFDRWGFPLTLEVSTTGNGGVWLSALTFDPDTAITWLRAGLWVAAILASIVSMNLDLLRRAKSKDVV